MAFAIQNNMHEQIMGKMGMLDMECDTSTKNNTNSCCISSGSDYETIIFNNTFNKKNIKIKFKNFIDIFTLNSKFLENKNLLKKTSPPYIFKKIKYYSYLDLTKITKSNT